MTFQAVQISKVELPTSRAFKNGLGDPEWITSGYKRTANGAIVFSITLIRMYDPFVFKIEYRNNDFGEKPLTGFVPD
jgi:hypothetical protein